MNARTHLTSAGVVAFQSFKLCLSAPIHTAGPTASCMPAEVSRLETLTAAGNDIPSGKVKAHMGVRGGITADAAAKAVVTQKILDADPDNEICNLSTQELRDAQIDIACQISNNAHEHHEWPVHPMPEGTMKADDNLREMVESEGMLVDGTWPDGNRESANRSGPR